MDNCRVSSAQASSAPVPAELTVFHAGRQVCAPRHRWSGVRDHYLIHYVLGGSGVFRYRGMEYHLSAGSGFTIFPGEYADYEAADSDPWRYCWIGFHGASVRQDLESVGVTSAAPIFTYDRDSALGDCILECMEAGREPVGRDFALRSTAYRLLQLLAQEQAPRPSNSRAAYVAGAISFLNRNFSHPVTIAEAASYVGIDRRYLAEIFRAATGRSPQDYLLNLRVAKAEQLLRETDLSVGAVARSVGYSDALYFSRLFRRKTGTAPSSLRAPAVLAEPRRGGYDGITAC